jgi:hypothetical protein
VKVIPSRLCAKQSQFRGSAFDLKELRDGGIAFRRSLTQSYVRWRPVHFDALGRRLRCGFLRTKANLPFLRFV